VKPEAALKYDVERVNYPVDLRLVAECVDVPVDELVDLNPSLLRRITPKDQPFDLHLPPGTKDKYETAIASIPEGKRVAWRYHKVQSGETLAGVARKYHTTERAIVQVNSLQGDQLLADSKLIIPVSAAANGRISYSRHPSRYRVHSGDTVLSVAEDFGVPPERLRRWNHLKGNSLRRGRVLVVYKPLAPGEVDRAPRHTTKSVQQSGKRAIKKAAKPKSTGTVAESTR
jgi:membrane-bound lytic murein transglycosylase D